MAENVLSQDEIDALLSAMDKGEVELEEEEEKEVPVVVESYDLTAQSAMLRHQFYALEEVYDKFASLLDGTLTSSLQKTIEIEYVSSEMVKYGEFLQAFSSPTSFNIFNMEPLIGSSLMVIESGLTYSLINCMFGGNGKVEVEINDFTMIEKRMITRLAEDILGSLEKAWEIVYPIRIRLKKAETKPEYVHLVTPEDLMIVIVMLMSGDEFSGNFHLCIPYRMLEPIKDKLSSKYLREKDMEDAFSSQLQTLLKDADVNVVGELGRTTLNVNDLLNLKKDDVVTLNSGPDDPVMIFVQKVPKYLGVPGIAKGNRAIQIKSMLTKNRV